MTAAEPPIRTLFVGGPGRSGTTVVAQRIAQTDGAVAFPGVELKFFTEKNGILDLWHSLGQHYSPNRATVAMRQFRQFTRDLIEGRFSQPAFSKLAPAAGWHGLFDAFTAALEPGGHPAPATAERFDAAVRTLVGGLHRLALGQPAAPPEPRIFVDNTPHTVLEARFLTRLLPDAAFLHVMRDPRSIAQSLRSMPWGPPDLERCCAWVASYCQAWAGRAKAPDIDLMTIHIEDLAAAPHDAGARIGAWLGIGNPGPLFAYTDLQTLNGWANRADPGDRALLDRRLNDWVRYFGYCPDAIGCRADGPSGQSGTASAASVAAGT